MFISVMEMKKQDDFIVEGSTPKMLDLSEIYSMKKVVEDLYTYLEV